MKDKKYFRTESFWIFWI